MHYPRIPALPYALLCLCLWIGCCVSTSATDIPVSYLDVSTGARALDGSSYAYYFGPPASGAKSTRWTINIEGGGWCYNETLCAERALTSLGSSTKIPQLASYGCAFGDAAADECNYVFLPYLDGASFSGYVEKPIQVGNQTIYFRGWRNFIMTLQRLASLFHLGDATEIILTGGSAGGLSTFLHLDFVATMFPNAKVRGLPIVGFFLDHPNYVSSSFSYPNWMKYIYHMQNLTAAALMPACLDAFPSAEAYKCFMAPHMQQFIKTPYFMFNSKYDQWQMDNILQVPCIQHKQSCSAAEKSAILAYGKSFLDAFAAVRKNPDHGAFITSCICHGCPWSSLFLPQPTGESAHVNSFDLFWQWYTGKVSGAQAIAVDPRDPDGNGTLSHGCQAW